MAKVYLYLCKPKVHKMCMIVQLFKTIPTYINGKKEESESEIKKSFENWMRD